MKMSVSKGVNSNSGNITLVLLLVCFVASFFNVIYAEANASYQQITSLIKYICLLCLYLNYLKFSFTTITGLIPFSFLVFIFLLPSISPYDYSVGKIVVLFFSLLFLFVILNTSLVLWQYRLLSILFFSLLLYLLFVPNPTDFINPNQTAFLYLILYSNILCTFKMLKLSRINSIIYSVSAFILCGVGIVTCNSRTSLIVLVCIAFFSVFLKKFKKPLLIFGIICIIGIIIPYIYTEMSADYSIRMNMDLDFSDKNFFSGRQIVWSEIIENLKDKRHFFYGGIELFWWDKSNHNSFFDIIVDFGFIVMIIILIIYGFYLKKYFSIVQEDYHSIIYSVFFLFIWGYTESGLFLGNSILVMMPIALVIKENKKGQVVKRRQKYINSIAYS